MKHTPGPWTFGVYDATDNFRSIKQHSCVCDPEIMALIATCGPADDPQSQKDARLIAEAPALLEACKATLDWIERAEFIPGEDVVTALLEAAIAAVEGVDP